MLFIVTCEADTTATWFEQHYLCRSDIPWIRFNTEFYPGSIRLDATDESCRITGLSRQVASTDDARAIWFRRPMSRTNTPAQDEDPEARYTFDETAVALQMFYGFLDHALWVNRPSKNAESSEKLHQLRQAKKIGFRVPETAVTTDPELVAMLAERFSGKVIAKPLGKGSVSVEGSIRMFYSTLLDQRQITDAAPSIRRCPLIFQEPIPKAFELRVTVIGERCFAVRLDSQAVPEASTDWRRSPYKVAHQAFPLPEDVSEKCVRITRDSSLIFAAFDLIVTPEGEFVFLEYNPNGQFAWLEEMTGIPIGGALLDLFAQAMK